MNKHDGIIGILYDYFRTGNSAFLMTFLQAWTPLTTTYILIKVSFPSLFDSFPFLANFPLFVLLALIIGVPLTTLLGKFFYKSQFFVKDQRNAIIYSPFAMAQYDFFSLYSREKSGLNPPTAKEWGELFLRIAKLTERR